MYIADMNKKRVNITIDEKTHKRGKRQANKKGISFSAWVRQLILKQ